jgi:hypothetical protein
MTEQEIKREIEREHRLGQLFDLADKYLQDAIARGEAYTEDLSNRVMQEALSDLDFSN